MHRKCTVMLNSPESFVVDSWRKKRLFLFINNIVSGLHCRQGITRHRVDEKVDTEAEEDLSRT